MKWLALAGVAALGLAAAPATAQRNFKPEVVYIGNIAKVQNNSPKWWAISGFFIAHIARSDGQFTPIMRTEVYDARTVEILSRTEAPPLSPADVHVMGNDVVVRRFLLMRALPQDARAAGTSQHTLAERWANSVRRVLPAIQPRPGRFGV